MPDQQLPPNPFQRNPEPEDPRSSKLFAATEKQGHLRMPYEDKVQTSSRTAPPKISARREMRNKNLKIRRNILIAISVAIGLILALIATDTLKLGTGPHPSFSKTGESITRPRGKAAKVEGEQVQSLRNLTASNPLRVYIGGDSLVGSFGNPLATDLSESGVIKATYDSRPSSGLVNTDFFNWNQHARDILSQYDPEVVIFMIGANDASIVSSNPQGYVKTYTDKLNSFLDILSPTKRKVFFVLAPAMRETALNTNLNKLNDIIYSVAHKRNAETIESGDTLSPSGKFSIKIKVGSKDVTVRADDGVHIAGEGGTLLSKAIVSILNTTFLLSKYNVSPAIAPTKVPGCCTSPKSVPSGTVGNSTTSSTSVSESSTSSTTPVEVASSSSTSVPTTVSITP